MLTDCPTEMGLSYPANAVWRYWALAKSRAIQVVLDDFRTCWDLTAPAENNTLAEDWVPAYDTNAEWSHCPVAPLILLYHGILGLRPTSPGYATCVLAPQLGDLEEIACQAHTVRGAIRFAAKNSGAGQELTLFVPAEIQAELILDAREKVALPPGREPAPPGCKSYALPKAETVVVTIAQANSI
jgi:hypothetical protein